MIPAAANLSFELVDMSTELGPPIATGLFGSGVTSTGVTVATVRDNQAGVWTVVMTTAGHNLVAEPNGTVHDHVDSSDLASALSNIDVLVALLTGA